MSPDSAAAESATTSTSCGPSPRSTTRAHKSRGPTSCWPACSGWTKTSIASKKPAQPPPVLAYVDEDDDEALFASAPPQQTYDTPSPSTWRRCCPTWALRRRIPVPGVPARRLAHVQKMRFDRSIVPYGWHGARIITDEHWLGLHAGAAHPSARRPAAQGRVLPVEPTGAGAFHPSGRRLRPGVRAV